MALAFFPLVRLSERVTRAKNSSDHEYFDALLLCAEFQLKLITLAFIASLGEHQDRPRYRLLHQVVRGDGLGTWVEALTDSLVGPASQHLTPAMRQPQAAITQKLPTGSWQFEFVHQISHTLQILGIPVPPVAGKTSALRGLELIAHLRNKTKAHGAKLAHQLALAAPILFQALDTLGENCPIWQLQWAVLHRNLSGKYRVTNIGESSSSFSFLTKDASHSFHNGVYLWLDEPRHVDLAACDPELRDFLVANGGFTEKKYELISYITGDVLSVDSGPYLHPATPLPPSETDGTKDLDLKGNSLTNLPTPASDYVRRGHLEKELRTILEDDRHPVVTLAGRGGIGKTSLALQVLTDLTTKNLFETILWFSARDIDLRLEGPKLVRPSVLDIEDVAVRFKELTGVKSSENPAIAFGNALNKPLLGNTLFVFDNFETMTHPQEFYLWINQYVRIPNKVLITTRSRAFKGDYPIDVYGMEDNEARELVDRTAALLGITGILDPKYIEKIIQESNGHPYVIKVLLGEVTRQKKKLDVAQVVRSQPDILNALFERVYEALPPVSKRVFLTLSNWNSSVLTIGLKAVLARPDNDAMDVDTAIEQLRTTSLIEMHAVEDSNEETFLTVPLAAALFGRAKLTASELRGAVEADVDLLRKFGATQSLVTANESQRHVGSFVRAASKSEDSLKKMLPILQYIAGRVPRVWLDISDLYLESELMDAKQSAKDAIRHYLEHPLGGGDYSAWVKLSQLCRSTSDSQGELNALVGAAEQKDAPFYAVSDACNRFNQIVGLQAYGQAFEKTEVRALSRRLIDVMHARRSELDADAHSRLAWLWLKIEDEAGARKEVQFGLKKEPTNDHCLNLAKKLGVS